MNIIHTDKIVLLYKQPELTDDLGQNIRLICDMFLTTAFDEIKAKTANELIKNKLDNPGKLKFYITVVSE